MSADLKLGLKLQADASQYKAELTSAGQTLSTFTAQVHGGGASAASALQGTTTAAQAMGSGLRAAGLQGAEGLNATAAAAQASQAAGVSLLAGLREQIAVSGKSTDQLLRYRAAQAGVAAEAAPLILQLQNQRAAQQHAAESARAEEAAQRANAAAKQQSAAAQESFLTGLREQAALQGKTQAEVMRYRAAQLGVAEGAEQYIRALEQGNSVHRVGALSAKEHAMAMRMLPMQMTDVVTSVASGMPIWMVAIQQGGQIKDSFGGVGNALRAILGAISPTVAGIGLLAGAAGLASAAYYQGSREADGYRQAIVMTGNAAGTTVNQLTYMARAMSQISGTQGAAAESLTALAGTGAIASENLQQFATVAIELERRVGQPIKTTAQHLEELAKAPLQASLKLNEQYHYLSESVYRQIKALQDQGKQEEAAGLAQRTYANAMAERTAELRSNLGTLERTWEGLGNTARRAWDAMLNIGRAATLSDVRSKIEDTNRQLNDLIAGDGFDSTGGGAATGTGGRGRAAQIERLKKQLGELQAQAAPLEAEDAQAQMRAEKQATDAIELAARQRVDALKKAARSQADIRKQEIDQLNRDRETLRLSTEEYNALLAGINEKYKDKKAAGTGQITVSDADLANMRGQLEAARQYHQQLLQLGVGASDLNAAERESLKIAEQLKVATDAKTIARLQEKQAIADALAAQTRSNEGLEKSLKAHQTLIDTTARDAEGINQRAKAQDAANAVFGKGRTAIEQMTLAELEKQMAEAQGSDNFDPKYIASLELKIAAQKRYVASLQGADYKAVEQHVDELLRGAQELAKAYEDEQALSGLTALEREKIVAQRQVELKYAKELAAIDAKALTDAEKQALREKALEARRIESAAAVAKAQQQYMARAADEINRSLTDALMRGFESGKGFAENLADTVENMFNTMVLRPVISAIMTPVSLVINGIVQQGLNAVGLGSGRGGGGSGGMADLISLGKNIYSAISNGFSGVATDVAYAVQRGLNFLNPSNALGAPGGFASGVGTIAGYGAGILGGVYGGRMISGGYSMFGSGNSVVNGGTIIGALLGGPIGALLGGLAGGVVNRLFGRKLKDSGIEGDFGGESGFEGRRFEYYKGGLFRSNKTKYKDLDEETRAAFANTFNAMRSGAKEMAGVLGLGTEAIDSFTAHIKISLKDLSPEEADKRIKEELDKIAVSLASTVLGTDEYSRANETALDTLTRLSSSLVGVNAVFENLGYTLYASSLAGADMASQLMDLFGGAEGFNNATGTFFQNFYSRDEQREAMRRAMQTQLDTLGMDLQLPDINASNAREQFRALAEAQDRSTEEGRKAWAMLMQLSGAFAQITTTSEDAAAAEKERQRVEADARKAATDAAWAAMQKSIQAARDAAQAEIALREERLAAARAVVDLTRDQARELRSQVDSTVAMTAVQANAWIDNALTASRSGQLPDTEGLRQAITDARAGMGTSAYGNRLDYEAAQLILANKLDAIGDSGTAQVDVNELLLEQAKNEVDRLDQMLKAGQAALDEARGNTVAVRDVEAAVREFYERLFDEKEKNGGAASGGASDTGARAGSDVEVIGGTEPGSASKAPRIGERDANGNYTKQVYLGGHSGYRVTSAEESEHLNNVDFWLEQWRGTGDVKGMLTAARTNGYTMSDIATVMGWDYGDIVKRGGEEGVPRFASGGSHLGGLRLVGEEGPELEATGPARIYNARQTQQMLAGLGGGNADLAKLLQALISQSYTIGRRQIELLQTMETITRKTDAIGVKQREAEVGA